MDSVKPRTRRVRVDATKIKHYNSDLSRVLKELKDAGIKYKIDYNFDDKGSSHEYSMAKVNLKITSLDKTPEFKKIINTAMTTLIYALEDDITHMSFLKKNDLHVSKKSLNDRELILEVSGSVYLPPIDDY